MAVTAPSIRSQRHHGFTAPTDDLWSALTSVDRYRDWWPWLTRFDADGFATGSTWSCAVRPPLGYTLSFDLVLDEVREGATVAASVRGDLVGTASLEVRALADPARPALASEVVLCSDLTANGLAVRALATVARPIAVRGHDWILDTGLAQFEQRALAD